MVRQKRPRQESSPYAQIVDMRAWSPRPKANEPESTSPVRPNSRTAVKKEPDLEDAAIEEEFDSGGSNEERRKFLRRGSVDGIFSDSGFDHLNQPDLNQSDGLQSAGHTHDPIALELASAGWTGVPSDPDTQAAIRGLTKAVAQMSPLVVHNLETIARHPKCMLMRADEGYYMYDGEEERLVHIANSWDTCVNLVRSANILLRTNGGNGVLTHSSTWPAKMEDSSKEGVHLQASGPTNPTAKFEPERLRSEATSILSPEIDEPPTTGIMNIPQWIEGVSDASVPPAMASDRSPLQQDANTLSQPMNPLDFTVPSGNPESSDVNMTS